MEIKLQINVLKKMQFVLKDLAILVFVVLLLLFWQYDVVIIR